MYGAGVARRPGPIPRLGWARPPAAPAVRLMALGQDVPAAPPSQPDVVTWDPTMTTSTGRGIPENAGCPDGYFAQFVGQGEPGAVSVPGKSYAVRCRLMTTTTPQTIVSESGITWREAADVYAGAVADTAKGWGAAIQQALSWAPWILIPAVVLGGLVVLRAR